MKRFSTLNQLKSSSFLKNAYPSGSFTRSHYIRLKRKHLQRFVNRRFLSNTLADYEPSKQVVDRILQYSAALEVIKTSRSVCFKILN